MREMLSGEPPRVALVTDTPAGGLAQRLVAAGFGLATVRPHEARAALASLTPEVIILEATMPLRGWLFRCAALAERAADVVPIVVAASCYRADQLDMWLAAGAADALSTLTGTAALEARIRTLAARGQRLRTAAAAAQAGAEEALSRALAAYDGRLVAHGQRVAALAGALGRSLDLDGGALEELRRAALLHDIGKIGLSRQGPRSLARLREHPSVGASIVAALPAGNALVPIVRHHHERWDGQGYPDGLLGPAIPLAAHIVGIASAFDTLTAAYRLSPALALAQLGAAAGRVWSPAMVAALYAVVNIAPPLAERVVGEQAA